MKFPLENFAFPHSSKNYQTLQTVYLILDELGPGHFSHLYHHSSDTDELTNEAV
jgi:uncharacterized cupin superfamily protein